MLACRVEYLKDIDTFLHSWDRRNSTAESILSHSIGHRTEHISYLNFWYTPKLCCIGAGLSAMMYTLRRNVTRGDELFYHGVQNVQSWYHSSRLN